MVTVTVVEVVDGDTIRVAFANGSTETVRLVGVDGAVVNERLVELSYASVYGSQFADRPAYETAAGTARAVERGVWGFAAAAVAHTGSSPSTSPTTGSGTTTSDRTASGSSSGTSATAPSR